MKFEFIEGKYGTQITLIPETVEETGKLLRTAINAKSVPISIHYSFSDGDKAMPPEPHCNIWIGKVDPKKQFNSVSNKRKDQ